MEKTLYRGVAVGGPMDGAEVEGRYPGGILFVDKASEKAWLYDFYAEEGKFFARPVGYDALWDEMSFEQKMQVINETTLAGVDPVRELDREKRLAAAESSNTEVRALPEGEGVV